MPKNDSGIYMAHTVAPTTQWTSCAQEGPPEDPLLLPPGQPCQTQHGEGHQIVPQDGLPADGKAPVEDHLEQAVGKAAYQPPLRAPADGEEKDGQHPQGDGAAPGHLPQLQHTQDLGQRHKHGALAQHTQVLIFHSEFLLSFPGQRKKPPGRDPGRAAVRSSYAGIIRIRFPGDGRRRPSLSRHAPAPRFSFLSHDTPVRPACQSFPPGAGC